MNVSPWQHCLWRRKSCFLGQKEKGQSLCVVQRAETSSSLCVFSRVCHAHCEEVCSISFTSVASLLLGEVDLVWGQQRWCKRQNNTDWVSSSAAGGLVSYSTLHSVACECIVIIQPLAAPHDVYLRLLLWWIAWCGSVTYVFVYDKCNSFCLPWVCWPSRHV